MAISFVQFSTLQASTAGITVGVPSGYQADDILLLHLFGEGDATHPASISGWTQIGTTERSENSGTNTTVSQSLWWRLSTASESSVTVADMGAQSMGWMTCWRGADTTNPIHVVAQSSTNTQSTSQSATGVTTTAADCAIIASICSGDGVSASGYSATDPSTMTEVVDHLSNIGSDGSGHVAWGEQSSTGASGSVSWTYSAAEEHATYVIAMGVSQDKDGTASVSGSGTVTTAQYKHTERTVNLPDTVAVTLESHKTTPRDVSISGSGTVTAAGHKVTNVDIRVGFENPTGVLYSGTNRQVFRTIVRRHLAGTDDVDPTIDMWLYEDGVQIRQLASATITSDSGQIVSGFWDAAEITEKNNVECRIRGNMTSGPNGGRSIDIETIEWAAQGSDVVAFEGTATITGSATVSVSAQRDIENTISISGISTVTASGTAVEYHTGATTISGSATVSYSGYAGFQGSDSITGTGTVSVSGEKGAESAVSISSTGTITYAYSAGEAKSGTASVSGSGTVTSIGAKGSRTTIEILASGTVTVEAGPDYYDSITIAETGTVTASGEMGAEGTATVSGTGTLTTSYDLFAPTVYLYPDGVLDTNMSGTYTDIDDPIASPDNNWMEA